MPEHDAHRVGLRTRDERRATQLARTVEVVAAALLPRQLAADAARALAAPVLVALAGIAAALTLGVVVALELAVAAWGSGAVAVAVTGAALLAPTARLWLACAPPVVLALTRCAPLLRSLDLGGAPLARHWMVAAAAPVLVPTLLLGAAAALVLVLHDELAAALMAAGAAALGSLAALAVVHRGARRAAAGDRAPGPGAMAARRLALVGVVACLAVAAAPHAPGIAPTAAAGAGLAAAVWVWGDGLALDARPWLRLQAALVDGGAPVARLVARATTAGACAAAGLGTAVGTGVGAVAGADAGLRAGLASVAVGAATLAVLVLEPDPRAVVARCLACAVAVSPPVGMLVASSPAGWIGGSAAAVGAVAAVSLARRIA